MLMLIDTESNGSAVELPMVEYSPDDNPVGTFTMDFVKGALRVACSPSDAGRVISQGLSMYFDEYHAWKAAQ